ncbi:MAG: hypothetical protein ACYC6O_08445 [Thermoleophilia bacterium]
MKKKIKHPILLIIVSVSIAIPIIFVLLAVWYMRVQTYVVEIPQDIGGKLVCNASYSCDQFGCDSLIGYNLVNSKGETTRIGYGTFEGEDWDRNIQIQKVQNRLLLKTETRESTISVIFIGDINGTKWTEYEFSSDNLAANQLWKASGIKYLPNDTSSFSSTISEIKENGEIDLIYEFRTTKGNMDTDKRLLVYMINSDGVPYLAEIKGV